MRKSTSIAIFTLTVLGVLIVSQVWYELTNLSEGWLLFSAIWLLIICVGVGNWLYEMRKDEDNTEDAEW